MALVENRHQSILRQGDDIVPFLCEIFGSDRRCMNKYLHSIVYANLTAVLALPLLPYICYKRKAGARLFQSVFHPSIL